MEYNEHLLRKFNKEILANDKQLKEELADKVLAKESILESANEVPFDAPGGFELETIVLKKGRPVLRVAMDEVVLGDIHEPESEVWRDRLINARQVLAAAIPSVGRIELEGSSYDWVGTGWMVANDTIVTNRHVAEIFGRKGGAGFVFRQGNAGSPISASVDFLEEADRLDELVFKLTKILHIEAADGLDIAFLQVEPLGAKLPRVIELSDSIPLAGQQVVTIGYPASDSRIPDYKLMKEIFGDVFNKKRVAPGNITNYKDNLLYHDCSTLGGNSGSIILDLASGTALGLHFAGRFLESNYAVSAATIKTIMRNQKIGSFAAKGHAFDLSEQKEQQAKTPTVIPIAQIPSVHHTTSNNNIVIPEIVVPIKLNISINVTSGEQQTSAHVAPQPVANKNDQAGSSVESGELFAAEGRVADYENRHGYQPLFLGDNMEVPLPQIKNKTLQKDILTFSDKGSEASELKYQHFSVLMSRSRRMCFYSAVNINGKTSFGMKREGWRFDPRIPQEYQIMKECYGSAPKFSRGHMTRREDPIWGTEEEGALGNADSMHVTNTVPQMQTLNGVTWLALENYALQNARKDKMQISVFTGPVLKKGDPIQYGVQIPLAFWKVIAFIHDDTGKLCATGYLMSQEDHMKEVEFVFDSHPAQVSIASIEKLTGLSFGELKDIDPMATATESVGGEDKIQITDLAEIRFF